ncbi:hypothetical protein BgiBS90_002205, partial [Biomphalaria glabrata]
MSLAVAAIVVTLLVLKVTTTRLAHNTVKDNAPIPSVSVTTVCAATVLTRQLLHQLVYRQLLLLQRENSSFCLRHHFIT